MEGHAPRRMHLDVPALKPDIRPLRRQQLMLRRTREHTRGGALHAHILLRIEVGLVGLRLHAHLAASRVQLDAGLGDGARSVLPCLGLGAMREPGQSVFECHAQLACGGQARVFERGHLQRGACGPGL